MRLEVGRLTRLSTWATALLMVLGFVFHLSVDNSARGFPYFAGDILVRYIIRSVSFAVLQSFVHLKEQHLVVRARIGRKVRLNAFFEHGLKP